MEEKKFIAAKELGKLAKWMRILGYDSVYHDRGDEAELVIQALRERRIILARSPWMSRHKGIKAIIVKRDLVEDQLDQVVEEAGLAIEEEKFFTRCVECNTLLIAAAKEDVREKVPAYVFGAHDVFKKCERCKKIYWKGSHWDMVGKWLEERGFRK